MNDTRINRPIYGPAEKTLNDLRGIRYLNDNEGAEGANGDQPENPEQPENQAPENKGEQPEPKPEEKPSPQDGKEAAGEEKPPWGSDAEFTPDAAWKLLQAKTEDAKRHQRTAQYLRDEAKGKDDRITELETKLAEYEEKEAAQSTLKTKKELLEAAGLDPEDEDWLEELTGSDQAVWEAKIAKWAKKFTTTAPDAPRGPNRPDSGVKSQKTQDEEIIEAQKKRNRAQF